MKAVGLVLFSIIFAFTLLYSQDVPRVISYQGVLIDAQGKPISGVTKTLTFSLAPRASAPSVSWSETISSDPINGGLFTVALGLQNSFPILEGEYTLVVREGGSQLGVIPIYSAASALNIPDGIVTNKKLADNSVTTNKIKDGEVSPQDLKPGNYSGEILKYDGSNWILAEDEKGLEAVSVIAPITGDATPSNPLSVSVPNVVPVGTIVAFFGNEVRIPDGWLLCDGRTFVKSDYPQLSDMLDNLGLYGRLHIQIRTVLYIIVCVSVSLATLTLQS